MHDLYDIAAQREDAFEEILPTFQIRLATWLHSVHEIAVPISWSTPVQLMKPGIGQNASCAVGDFIFIFLGRCGSLIVHACMSNSLTLLLKAWHGMPKWAFWCNVTLFLILHLHAYSKHHSKQLLSFWNQCGWYSVSKGWWWKLRSYHTLHTNSILWDIWKHTLRKLANNFPLCAGCVVNCCILRSIIIVLIHSLCVHLQLLNFYILYR